MRFEDDNLYVFKPAQRCLNPRTHITPIEPPETAAERRDRDLGRQAFGHTLRSIGAHHDPAPARNGRYTQPVDDIQHFGVLATLRISSRL